MNEKIRFADGIWIPFLMELHGKYLLPLCADFEIYYNTLEPHLRLCKKGKYWHSVLVRPLVWFSGKTIRKKKNDKILIYAQHMSWFICFWLWKNRSLWPKIDSGTWKSDFRWPKIAFFPTFLRSWYLAVAVLEKRWNNGFRMLEIVFPAFSRAGALQG